MYKEKIILEPSSNTHILEANSVEVKKLFNGIMQLRIIGNGIVTHDEHGTIKTEAEHIIKYIQRKVKPITISRQNKFD